VLNTDGVAHDDRRSDSIPRLFGTVPDDPRRDVPDADGVVGAPPQSRPVRHGVVVQRDGTDQSLRYMASMIHESVPSVTVTHLREGTPERDAIAINFYDICWCSVRL